MYPYHCDNRRPHYGKERRTDKRTGGGFPGDPGRHRSHVMTGGQPLRVLLADPSPLQRRWAQALLPHCQIDLALAVDGPEALEFFQTFRPHVLVTELVLPGFSGLELLRRCRALDPKARLLVVTAASGGSATAAAFGAGADMVLLKPAQWPEILRVIRLLTDGPTGEAKALLEGLGAPRGWAGIHQAARCAALLAQGKDLLLKEIYLQVAREEHTTPACVSKNIERLVRELARRGADFGRLGLTHCPNGPNNKDFLTALGRAATFPL